MKSHAETVKLSQLKLFLENYYLTTNKVVNEKRTLENTIFLFFHFNTKFQLRWKQKFTQNNYNNLNIDET